MKKANPLNYKYLRKTLNPKSLNFQTTATLETLSGFIGQKRALQSIIFAINIQSQGYNLYAMGPSGIGKRSLVQSILESHALKQHVPPDWCYVHNFEVADKPHSLKLPAGTGFLLQQDMKLFVNELGMSIISIFESDEYQTLMLEISKDYNNKRKKLSKDVINISENDNTPYLYKEQHEEEKSLLLKLTASVIAPLIKKLKIKYKKLKKIIKYLNEIEKDVISHVNDFVKTDEKTNLISFDSENPNLYKYQINLLVDNEKQKGAPVIFEENPSYSNLICRVEHAQQLGTMVTNFTLIKPGSLHKANGGYLVIEARKLKKASDAWEGLKRALYSHSIQIEPIEHLTDNVRPISLEPDPIPLNIKIILLGERSTYYSFCNHDPDFRELFKVAADFDEYIERNEQNIQLYAKLISTIAHREKTRPFHASAVAAIIDHSTRIAEDINKLSTHIREVDDLILESNYCAEVQHKKIVRADHVKSAIKAQIHRVDRTREVYYEDIIRNFIFIKTAGKAIAQINCLSVVKVGHFSYGHPTRLTARVRMGKWKLIDIQREIDMGGPILTKGGLIISHFLSSRYIPDKPCSLSASLSFEQIYGEIDGDSSSIAELCVLLSALSEVPLHQNFAITGSSNQLGEVQVVGGINAKIEGFFDICNARGLTGNQGVIIPKMNSKNLMLREDVVAAVKNKKFSIYLIETIDEAISLLTGVPAGKRGKNGFFPADSINGLVENKLQRFAINYKKSKN